MIFIFVDIQNIIEIFYLSLSFQQHSVSFMVQIIGTKYRTQFKKSRYREGGGAQRENLGHLAAFQL